MADRAQPVLSRGRALRRRTAAGGARPRRHPCAPVGGEPGRVARRACISRADPTLRDSPLATSSRKRAGARARRRRGRGFHGSDEPPARNPDCVARALRCTHRLLRRRRTDELARVRRDGHRLQHLPRSRSGRVRPGAFELGRRGAEAGGTRGKTGGSSVLGRRSGTVCAAACGEGARRLLLRLRRQVPPELDGGADRRAEQAADRCRLRPRRH